MNANPWICLPLAALLFVAGRAVGFLPRSSGAAVTEAPAARRSASPRNLKEEAGRSRWVAKIADRKKDGLRELIGSIPSAELGPAVEAWFLSYSLKGVDEVPRDKLKEIFDAWAARDFDGAWDWATSLEDPLMRELSVVSLAANLAENDPRKAFECLSSLGSCRTDLSDSRWLKLLRTVSQESLAGGSAGLAEFLRRMPKAENTVSVYNPIVLKLPPGGDFKGVMDVVLEADPRTGSRPAMPVTFNGVMQQWMKEDPEAARRYVRDRVAAGQPARFAFQEMAGVVRQEQSPVGLTAWSVDFVRGLPEEQRAGFLMDSGVAFGNATGDFDAFLKEWGTPEEGKQLRQDLLQSLVGTEKENYLYSGIAALPMPQRIAMIENLRGLQSPELVRRLLEEAGLPEERLVELEKRVAQPRE